jgi:hypothetical protein
MEQAELQLMFGYGVMPEARTKAMEEETAEAIESTFRVGATDWLWLQIKGWWDVSGHTEEMRQGYSFSPTFTLKRDYHGFDFGLMPTGVLCMTSSDALGGGGTLSGCIWFPKIGALHLYSAIGGGYGIRDDDGVGDKWGWIATVNYGAAILIADHITLNLETSAIYQYNHYDEQTDRFFVPSLNMGVIFRAKRLTKSP